MKHFLIFAFLFFCLLVKGQNTIEIEKGVYVTFPQEPERILYEDESEQYRLSTDDYILSIVINKNVMPNYSKYEDLKKSKRVSPAQIEEFEGDFIDGYIVYLFGENHKKSNFKLGKYFGRNIKTKTTYPEIEVPAKRFLKMVLINNTMITLDAGYLYESELTNQIIDEFLNSLRLK